MGPRGIHAIAVADPGRVALVHEGRETTYGELEASANRAARAFAAAGVGPGDRAAVMLRNRPEVFVAWNAAARLGALVVPINVRLTSSEVAYLLADSGSRVLVYDDRDAAEPALAGLEPRPAAFHLDDPALRDHPAAPPTEEFLGAPVTMMSYTSGTTGRPKGVERAPPQPARHAPPQPFAEFWGFGPDDVHLLCGPAYHTAPGAYAQMHLVEGAKVVVMRRFDAGECLRLISSQRVTNSHMVPANFIRILEVDWRRHDLSSVRKILHAAAPCPVEVKQRIMEVFPRNTVWEYYGASEGMGTVISPEEWLRKPGSVGRAFPGRSIKILDEQGRELPPGQIGIIYISAAPGSTFGYHNDPEKTREAWRGDSFTVGDLGRLDEDGYLFIADRRVDLVISGGVNIYPAEIERALAGYPDVLDSAVFGLPDERMGQRVHAVVEMRPGAPRDAEALAGYLRGRLAAYKLPKTFEFIDELPREPDGKVLKRRLREARMAGGPPS